MFESSDKITKHKITVEIELNDGKHMVGYMFPKPQGRLTNMMNDQRIFLPFETMEGKNFVVRKTSCLSVGPITDEADVYEGNNPFQIHGVSDNATLAEIKQRYHTLCAGYHPDRLNSMGLPKEFIDLATTKMSPTTPSVTDNS